MAPMELEDRRGKDIATAVLMEVLMALRWEPCMMIDNILAEPRHP